jgi:ribosomal protein S18 acetylase RimI-like enzyme
MFLDYGTTLNDEVLRHYGVPLARDGNIKQFMEDLIPQYTSIKPPEGIIYILEENGKAAAMARVDTFEKGIGEVHNVYTSPGFRRKGYANLLMKKIEETALEFGLPVLRLDTAGFNVPAQRLYQKLGYSKIERYTSIDRSRSEPLQRYYREKWYMEKKI